MAARAPIAPAGGLPEKISSFARQLSAAGERPDRRLKQAIKQVVPADVIQSFSKTESRWRTIAWSLLSDPFQFDRPCARRECPICGYVGRFWSFGSPPRAEALCPDCFSLERHRLLQLLLDQNIRDLLLGQRVLHFAPEPFIRERLDETTDYVTADVAGHVDCRCKMESIPFPDRSFDAVVANHVLEHVADERGALDELRRVAKSSAVIVLSVPLVPGWESTYENEYIRAPEERRVHFGQEDHRRLYGRDFADRLESAGFEVEVFNVDPRSEVRFGLTRGETLYLARPRSRRRAA